MNNIHFFILSPWEVTWPPGTAQGSPSAFSLLMAKLRSFQLFTLAALCVDRRCEPDPAQYPKARPAPRPTAEPLSAPRLSTLGSRLTKVEFCLVQT